MLRHLFFAKKEIEDLINEIKAEQLDDTEALSLAIDFGTTLDYLNLAWNSKGLTMMEFDNITQDEYERLVSEIPNYTFMYKLQNGYTV